MITKAYFINPYGKILDIDTRRHIQIISKNPEKFGLNREDIEALYNKHGEKYSQEGKAREEIIQEIIKKGFIHIRQYRQFWAINFWKLNSKTKKALSTWAEHIIDNKIDRHGSCRLYELSSDSIIGNVTVQDIFYEQFNESVEQKMENENIDKKFNPMVVESIVDFEDLIPSTEKPFKKFIAESKKFLQESSLSRIYRRMDKHDYGTISAFRGNYTHEENMQRNKSLVSKMLAKGYSVTAIDGGYIENYDNDELENQEVFENSYFVADIKDKGTLEKDLRKWGEMFEQDSVMFGNAGEKPSLIGTSKRPGQKLSYGQKIMSFDASKFGYKGMFFSKVNNRPFTFESLIHDFEIPKYPSEKRTFVIESQKDWKDIQLDDEEKKSDWY